MSTIGGGGSGDLDKLIALTQFMQGPELLDRLKELRDVEASSKAASDKAAVDVEAARVATEALDKRQADIEAREARLEAAEKAHATKIAKLSKAIAENR